MSNITHPSTTTVSQNPQAAEEFVKPDSTQFQDLMKVKESEEKQKKKKKRPQEFEEEQKSASRTRLAAENKKVKSLKTQSDSTLENRGYKRVLKSTFLEAAAKERALRELSQSQEKELSQAGILEEKVTLSETVSLRQEEAVVMQETPPLSQPLPLQAYSETPLQKERKKPVTPAALNPPPSQEPLLFFLSPPAVKAPTYTLLSPEALALFEKMVSVMTVMHTSGITETTIHLNPEEFSYSSFQGTQIVIREYSSAPLMYNIELLGNAAAVTLFKKNLSSLENSFKEGKRKYKINRLEVSLLPVAQKN
ncbi:MAG: hypothetical protein QRY71_00100 [Candidatus Rhabdochlamydia sp.]